MKISENTISILRNFSDINANILFTPGKTLQTMSTMKNIMAKADVEENFESEFGVYDLPEFLRALDSFQQPVLNFNGSANLKIKDEKSSLSARYAFADKSTLRYPTKTISMPDKTVEVINLGISAVNSYTLFDQVDEIIEQKPDAILIYAGHNEFYGALGVGSNENLGGFPAFVRFYLKLQRFATIIFRIIKLGRVGLCLSTGAKARLAKIILSKILRMLEVLCI